MRTRDDQLGESSSRARASSPTGCATPASRASSTRSTSRAGRWSAGPSPSATGRATAEQKVGSPEWLVGEILRFRGEAVVLEPADLRRSVARRARELLSELGLARLRVKV